MVVAHRARRPAVRVVADTHRITHDGSRWLRDPLGALLLLARGLISGPMVTSVLAGAIIALCFVGIVGSAVAFVPLGLATILFEARDLRGRSAPVLWGVMLTAAAFVLTFALD